MGSSPRLRGTPESVLRQVEQTGIIPALAGNTMCVLIRLYAIWDHPRACGEHAASISCVCDALGSSPRLRGTQRPETIDVGSAGIIPALAGNTWWKACFPASTGDHPRACGEHYFGIWLSFFHLGSSPRLRGTRVAFMLFNRVFGIIPALAGNTASPCLRRSS